MRSNRTEPGEERYNEFTFAHEKKEKKRKEKKESEIREKLFTSLFASKYQKEKDTEVESI